MHKKALRQLYVEKTKDTGPGWESFTVAPVMLSTPGCPVWHSQSVHAADAALGSIQHHLAISWF